MPQYRYRAVDASGAPREGTAVGGSRLAVAEALQRTGVTALEVREMGPRWHVDFARFAPRGRAATRADLLEMTQQLAALLRAGVNLDRALSIARGLAARPAGRAVLDELLQAVRRGAALSEALSRQAVWPGIYIGLVRAGEAGGTLPEVLQRLAALLARADQARERIRSALIYPVILLVMMCATVVIVLTVVLPRFEVLFADARESLPWATRAVIALGHAVSDDGVLIAVGLLFAGAAGAQVWRSPRWRERVDALLLRTPILLGLPGKIESARFLSTVGTLIGNGIALPQALSLAARSVENRAMTRAIGRLVERLREGESFAVLLERARVFPPLAVQLARVGEETGRLEPMLLETAEILEREAQLMIERLLALIVPAATIGLGLLVAGLIASVLVGILSLNDLAL